MGHWYDRHGKSCHTVKGADGMDRDTTLRDARTLGLVPSVTTVLEVLAKPALTSWMVDQGILAALTLPRIDGEDEVDYLKRIKSDSRRQAMDAANEGTRIHAAIEDSFKGRAYDHHYNNHVDGVLAELRRAFPAIDDWQSERSFGHFSGYGGCVDLHSPSTGIVVDFKGKDIAPGDNRRLAFDQHYQLAAYQEGLGLTRAVCANVFVSRTHPGHVVSHVWTPEDIDRGFAIFRAALSLWKSIKGYDGSFDRQLAA